MDSQYEEKLRMARALRKIEARKGYFMHVAAYICMTAFILIAWAVDTMLPESFYTTSVFMIVVCGGAGLLVHTIIHFGNISFPGRKWEERMLRRFMEEEKQSSNQK